MFFSFKVVIWQWNEWERVPVFCCFHQLCCFADRQLSSAWGWVFRLWASPINCLFWSPFFLISVYFIKCPGVDYACIFGLYNNGITFYCITSNSLWILFLSDDLGRLGWGWSHCKSTQAGRTSATGKDKGDLSQSRRLPMCSTERNNGRVLQVTLQGTSPKLGKNGSNDILQYLMWLFISLTAS